MMKNVTIENKVLYCAIFISILLKRITYLIGDFDFSNAPLFSFHSLYDVTIALAYGLTIIHVLNKIIAKKGRIKEKNQ